jgi:hypothetical protein
MRAESFMSNYVPIIFCRFYQIVDLGVYKFEDTLLRGLLVASELFCGLQNYVPAS